MISLIQNKILLIKSRLKKSKIIFFLIIFNSIFFFRTLINLSDDDSDNNDKVRAPIAPIQGPIIEQTFQQTYGWFFFYFLCNKKIF